MRLMWTFNLDVYNYNLAGVLNGDIDIFIDELTARDQAEKLSGTLEPAGGMLADDED